MSIKTNNGPKWKQADYSVDHVATFEEVCRREVAVHDQYVLEIAKEMSRPKTTVKHPKASSKLARRKSA